MKQTLIEQGISLMLYGMGTVFVFLTILVFATSLMSKLAARFSPQVNAEQTPLAQPDSGMPSASILQAIKQALLEHRKQ